MYFGNIDFLYIIAITTITKSYIIFVNAAKPVGLEEGLTREEFDEFLIEGLQEVAPSWPYPERLEDAIQSMR